jgi:hypothetical protein
MNGLISSSLLCPSAGNPPHYRPGCCAFATADETADHRSAKGTS